jgi:peptidoglycan-N-acetylglucosamine deacetylase
MIKNIMSVDLEDYYCDLPFNKWDEYPSRIVETTNILLELFESHNVSATFFTLGYIAQRHPELIEKIIAKGHEIASHGYSHTHMQNFPHEQDFESDLVKSLEIIEKVSGEKVLGFRAPYFSIKRKHVWAFNIIRKHLKYDSSIFPVRPHYELGSAPRYPYKMSEDDPFKFDDNSNFTEIPMSTWKFWGLTNMPIAGGFYLRFIPFWIINSGLRKINESGHSAMMYIHPKDLDSGMPKIKQYTWHYYWDLKSTTKKLDFLFKNFRFTSVRDKLNL